MDISNSVDSLFAPLWAFDLYSRKALSSPPEKDYHFKGKASQQSIQEHI